MKTIKFFTIALTAGIITVSCSSDDDNSTPPPVINEEEVITTVIVELLGGVGQEITLRSVDDDGPDGPNPPVITMEGDDFDPNEVYLADITFLNETEDPAEDITEEVEEEDDEHQVFFTVSDGLNITTEYDNFDGNDNPLGTQFTLNTGEVSTGNFTITLRHEPTKPNTGLADAGGETDIEVTFPIEILE